MSDYRKSNLWDWEKEAESIKSQVGYFKPEDFDRSTWPIPNAGTPWNRLECEHLGRLVGEGHSVATIARSMGRTVGGIEYRIEQIRGENESINPVNAVARKQEKFMNYNHLITILQKGYTTVNVSFSLSDDRKYAYKAAESMNLVPGAFVVVPARGEFKVATVCSVDPEPEIDIKAPYELKWVVARVDFSAYDEQNRREAEAFAMLKTGERKRAQAEAMETLLASVTNRAELMKLLGVPHSSKEDLE